MKCEGCEYACGYCPEGEYAAKPAEKQTKLLVGRTHLRKVSIFNNDLFEEVLNFIKKSATDKPTGHWRYGRCDLGNLVDWLEQNYNIEKKS